MNLDAIGETVFIPEGLSERVNIRELLGSVETEQDWIEKQEIFTYRRNIKNRSMQFLDNMETENTEDDAKLAKVKSILKLKAKNYAKRCLYLYVGALLVIWFTLGAMTWRFGWQRMEPWTFFFCIALTVGSYIYFAISRKEASPKAIYDQIVEWKTRKNYQDFDLHIEKI